MDIKRIQLNCIVMSYISVLFGCKINDSELGVFMSGFKSIFCLIAFFPFFAFSQILPFKFASSKEKISDFLAKAEAGPDAKLVFCESGKFYMAQFSKDSIFVKEIPSAAHGVLPVISPDGNYYTYAKGVTGDGEENSPCTTFFSSFDPAIIASPITVATPAYVPRFIQNSPDPTLIYSTCSKNPDITKHAWDKCGTVVKTSFVNNTFTKPEIVWGGGSYFGGLSYDNKYLCTAWLGTGFAMMLDITSSANTPNYVHLKVKNNITQTDSLIKIGVCNPSISSSRAFTNAMMFFDFGSENIPKNYSVPNFSKWALHEIIFISRFDGAILKAFKPPVNPQLSSQEWDALTVDQAAGQSYQREWNYPEWSNHPYLAAATIRMSRVWSKINGTTKEWDLSYNNDEYIFLINLKDSTFLPVLQTTDTTKSSKRSFMWPWLWAQIPSTFSESNDWLTSSISVKKKSIRNTSIINLETFLNDNNHIEICNLQGRRIWSGAANESALLTATESLLKNKIYFILVKDRNNKVVRCVKRFAIK
jgi:hypothetical protein